jgi:hypothetical protein
MVEIALQQRRLYIRYSDDDSDSVPISADEYQFIRQVLADGGCDDFPDGSWIPLPADEPVSPAGQPASVDFAITFTDARRPYRGRD